MKLLERLRQTKSKPLRPKPTRRQQQQLRWATRSFQYFLSTFVYTDEDGGTKFDPWPWQRDLAKHIRRFKRIITLKGRQLGCSWIAAAYALWVAMFRRGSMVLLVSQTEEEAVDLLAKVVFIFEQLPEFLRPERWKANTRSLRFREIHSGVVALPSTPRAGRGKTAKLVVADEHAFHQWAEKNYSALAPTIDAGGQFWVISTANGIGNTFADLCDKASQAAPWVIPDRSPGGSYAFGRKLREVQVPEDGWLPVFLPFDVRPGRTGRWWQNKLDAHPNPREHYQEYPRDPDECWVQTGRPRFEKEHLEPHKARFREPLPRGEWPAELRERFQESELKLFALPLTHHRYFSGADVAEGLEHGDYSDLSLFDADTGGHPEEVLTLHGHWPPDVFGELIDVIARVYPGVYGIERNNHGLAVILTCNRLGTPGLYRERVVQTVPGERAEPGKVGWTTSAISKPLMIDELEQVIRYGHIVFRDRNVHSELSFYQILKDGSTGAAQGKHDDRVMSRAIAVQMRKFLPPPPREDDHRGGGTIFGGSFEL